MNHSFSPRCSWNCIIVPLQLRHTGLAEIQGVQVKEGSDVPQPSSNNRDRRDSHLQKVTFFERWAVWRIAGRQIQRDLGLHWLTSEASWKSFDILYLQMKRDSSGCDRACHRVTLPLFQWVYRYFLNVWTHGNWVKRGVFSRKEKPLLIRNCHLMCRGIAYLSVANSTTRPKADNFVFQFGLWLTSELTKSTSPLISLQSLLYSLCTLGSRSARCNLTLQTRDQIKDHEQGSHLCMWCINAPLTVK